MPNLDLKQLRETFEKSNKNWVMTDVRETEHTIEGVLRGDLGKVSAIYPILNKHLRVVDGARVAMSKKDYAYLRESQASYAQLLDIAEAAEVLRVVAEDAIEQMCKAIAPSDAFTNSADALDAALAAYRKAREGK